MEATHTSLRVCVCVCVQPLESQGSFWSATLYSRVPGQIHRRLVNEAGDVSEDMEMGRHFHVPAPLFRKTEGNGTRHTCVSVPFLLFFLSSTL